MLDYRLFNGRSAADDVVKGLDLSDKTVLITGANAGIGFETAAALAGAGAHVWMAGRNSQRHQAAIQQIYTRHPAASVEFVSLDLGSLQSVANCVRALPFAHLDLLIANAGLITSDYQTTAEGFEMTVGVSHIGHASLIDQLLPRLLRASQPRVVMLSSSAHQSPKQLDFERLPYPEKGYSPMKAYGQAKLCNLLYARELQRRYGDQGLTACAVHPGEFVTTNIGSDSKLFALFMKLVSPFTKNPRQGAATTLVAALHEPTSEIAGAYLANCRPTRTTPEAENPEVAARLWDVTAAWLREHKVGQ